MSQTAHNRLGIYSGAIPMLRNFSQVS